MRTESFSAALLTTLVIASFTVFLLVAAAAKPLGASPDPATKDILPTDDSHVNEGAPDAVADSGVKYNMYIGWDEQYYLSERLYLKFDLENNLPSDATIENAVLRLYNKYAPSIGEEPYTDKTVTVDTKSVSGDNWDETTLTWNNAPSMGATVLDSQTIDKGLGEAAGTPAEWEWWSWDVTSYVQDEFAGDGTVSIGLMSQNEGTDDAVVWVYAKDAEEDQPRPHLLVTYTTEGAGDEEGEPTEIPWVYIGVAAAIIAIVAIVAVILKIRKPSRVAPKRVRKRKK